MKWPLIILTCLGLIAAFSAAVMTASLKVPAALANARATPAEVKVVTALRDLSAMTVLTEDAIGTQTVARDQAPKEHFSNPVQIIGKVLTVPMKKGQALTQAVLATEGTGLSLAGELPHGMRAMSISLVNYAGLEGLLYPGCVIDLLATFPLSSNSTVGKAISTTLLQSFQVLAVENQLVGKPSAGEKADAEKAEAEKSAKSNSKELMVTLLVDSKQAEALQLAMKHGTVSLVMRNPMDKQEVKRDATLLNERGLATLAEMMDPSELRGVMDGIASGKLPAAAATPAPIPEPTPTPAPQVAPTPRPRPQWDVDVIRGTKSETRTFYLSKGE